MKKIIALFCSLFLFTASFAQQKEVEATSPEKLEQLDEAVKKLQKLKISGYVQAQSQWGEKDASLNIGTPNENPEESFNRIGIRRGFLKFDYEEGIASGTLQFDMTERGFALKDAYLNVYDPWFRSNALRAGIFNRPFGYEISYSSWKRESPERSAIFRTLFPEERDLGAMLILQAAKTSPLNFLKLEAGLFAGNGIKQETDSRKDFIGHLSAIKDIGSNFTINGGVSYYNGSVYQGSENVYKMVGESFVLNNSPDNKGDFAKREYIGFDGQLKIKNTLGTTQLRGEYLFGKQPGILSNSKSPNASVLPVSDTYLRNFSGGYVALTHDLGTLPFSAVLKYDWYDPNTKIAGNNIGLNNTGSGDITQNAFGFGMLWYINSKLLLQAYYEINKNEKTENLTAYTEDRKDNIFTLRLQYKF